MTDNKEQYEEGKMNGINDFIMDEETKYKGTKFDKKLDKFLKLFKEIIFDENIWFSSIINIIIIKIKDYIA
jgi:CO dehydrogenase/acetyl-CoA synthase gamma subunit (corrinoid Fe-S protein)